jgi:hypothetical protein
LRRRRRRRRRKASAPRRRRARIVVREAMRAVLRWWGVGPMRPLGREAVEGRGVEIVEGEAGWPVDWCVDWVLERMEVVRVESVENWLKAEYGMKDGVESVAVYVVADVKTSSMVDTTTSVGDEP